MRIVKQQIPNEFRVYSDLSASLGSVASHSKCLPMQLWKNVLKQVFIKRLASDLHKFDLTAWRLH